MFLPAPARRRLRGFPALAVVITALLLITFAGEFSDPVSRQHGAAEPLSAVTTPDEPATPSMAEVAWAVPRGAATGTPQQPVAAGPHEAPGTHEAARAHEVPATHETADPHETPDPHEAPGTPAEVASSGEPGAVDHLAGLEQHELPDPERTVVRDADGTWVASFTYGAHTVTLAGPSRRFDEASAAHGVTSTTWVRVLPEPYRGDIDAEWLATAREDTSPDVLEVAMQYLPEAPEVHADDGTLLSGDADYGPLDDDGDRPVGSDWNDYQQRVATYGAGSERHVRRPTRSQAGAMDCSGFVRMVFGVRHPVPLTSKVDGGESLPRISRLQAREAPGVVPLPDRDDPATDLDAVRPGDLVFFDAGSDRRGIDHVGIHLGTDDAGNHRFISSRPSSNGPTMGDHPEPSLLDGDGVFARTFVATRRL